MSGVVVAEVSKRFGHRGVLDRVSLVVPKGQLFVLLGPSEGSSPRCCG
ncbi:MAG TPA: hypothetical protein VMV09_06805 [Candidatus Saccharimonadales bacterium]|nr:hypothetical protein [Candidatus Saccharimonadales bacterium]